MSSENKALQRGTKKSKGDFHNPYNFVPAFPRNSDNIKNSELGDRKPYSHGKYHHNLWSGTIAVKLTTKTPLLIPDAATSHKKNSNEENDLLKESEDSKEKDQHMYFDVRRDPNDKSQPYLPTTSIKGMLRTAYEIVTNSRYSIFVDHEDRLAYRMAAREVNVIPARVEQHEDGKLYLHLMEGKNIKIGNHQDNIMGGAAKLPRYKRISSKKEREYFSKLETDFSISFPLLYDNGDSPEHGKLVWVRLNEFGEDKIKRSIVTRIKLRDESINPNPPGDGDWHKGIVFISNENIEGKKYERVFIDQGSREPIEITSEILSLWEELIRNYQETHVKDLEKRNAEEDAYDKYLGHKPGKTAWSRHIYELDCEKLKPGTLCYVEFDKNDSNKILALLPVILSRRLYEIPPDRLLGIEDIDTYLRPSHNLQELSPADRVFGWVRPDTNTKKQKEDTEGQKEVSYKGNLRIAKVKCLSNKPIKDDFGEDGFPLAILGQPQPQQARFYAAKNKQGEPLEKNSAKENGYKNIEGGLRGRKVYPHHRDLPPDYWKDPQEDRTQKSDNGYFQEYRRPRYIKDGKDKTRDDQNRSIKAWVEPDTNFEFNLDITNLSDVELGALLWLLNLPEDHFHRLGGGKPLGFGSVHLALDLEKTDLRQGKDWQEYYRSLSQETKIDSLNIEECINVFKEEVEKVYNKNFDSVSFIKAFCISCKGFDDGKPIHYPRVRPENNHNGEVPPQQNGEGFKWFVENEKNSEKEKNLYSLPSLIDEIGLPYLSLKNSNQSK